MAVSNRLNMVLTAFAATALALLAISGYQHMFSDGVDAGVALGALLSGTAAVMLALRQALPGHGPEAECRLELMTAIHHDILTGLANRANLLQRLEELIRRDRAARTPMALLLMDLDRFKEINNTLGHHVGDQLLRQVAARIEGATDQADLRARVGGDEFCVLLTHCDAQAALAAARKIQTALEPPVTFNNMEIDVQCSIGIALFPGHGDGAEMLFRHAEVAMYKAKKYGTAPTTYTTEVDSHNVRRLTMVGELRTAIDGQQMLLHYQPKVDLSCNRTVGVEALVRWKHPQHGMIPPGEFIGLAEQSDLIRHLTYWVLDEALLQCHAWRQMGYTLNVAVNISARNLHDPGLPAKVAGLLAKWAVPADSITLEITENAIMIDPERAMKILLRLHNLGAHLSIDDFGTGYSSLVYLKKLPVSQIKVDRSFVIDMNRDEDDAAIVRSTIDLGHHMECEVVAEGVEDKETLEQLRALGCDHVQGYYVSRPLPADDISAWLHESHWGAAAAPPMRKVLS